MSTQIYQFTSNQNNQGQKVVGGLKETSIDVDQLIELNKNDLNQFKNSGLKSPSDFIKQKRVMAFGAPVDDFLNIHFKKPPKAFYEKKEVFLPDKDTRYNDPTGKGGNIFKSQVGTYVSYQQQQPTQKVYSTPPQIISSVPSQVVYAQPSTTVVYSQQTSNVTSYDPAKVVYSQPKTQVVYQTKTNQSTF